MSYLSQFAGGGNNPSALRDFYNHQYAFDSTYIKDFTAQDDQLMISLNDSGATYYGNGGPYVGENQSRMIKCTFNGRGDSANNSINGLGGRPFQYGKSGITKYNNTNREWVYVNDSISNYYYRVNNDNYYMNLAATNTNSDNPWQDWSRFIVHPTTNELWLFKKTNDRLYIRTVDVDGTKTLPTINVGSSGLTWENTTYGYFTQSLKISTPEINPTDDTIRVLMTNNSNTVYELVIGQSSADVNVLGGTGFNFTAMNNDSVRYKLAVVGTGASTKYAVCGEGQTNSGIMNVSIDGGDNWTTSNTANTPTGAPYYFSSPCVLGDNIYALVTDRAYEWSGSYPGGRLVLPSVGAVSTTIVTPSWASNLPLTGGTYLRGNGQGTALYAAGGCYTNADVYPHIVKYTG